MRFKKKSLNKFFLLMVLFVGTYKVSMSQVKYINNKEFESAFSQNPDLSFLSRRYDLLYILLLNPLEKQKFFQYDPELEELFNEYFPAMKLSNRTVGFVTQKTSIKQIIEDNKGKIFNCIFDEPSNGFKYTINYPIYVKGDLIAIVEVSSTNTFDIFYLKLENGIVQINWLGGRME